MTLFFYDSFTFIMPCIFAGCPIAILSKWRLFYVSQHALPSRAVPSPLPHRQPGGKRPSGSDSNRHPARLHHGVKVACFSLFLANKLHLTVDVRALLRGALLHDYFLYDWHEKNAGHRFHGFTHPGTALKNAQEDFRLTPVEQNIIARHMFPLCPIPPRCREAWLVCVADKYCALLETVAPLLKPFFSRARS